MSDDTYKLDELARAAGTSPRTVRYYVQRGLLPAPAFRGKDTAYAREHLVRLQAIRRLQEAFFPLDAIAVELEQRSFDEIERIADGSKTLGPAGPAARVEVEGIEPVVRQTNGARSSVSHARTFRRIEIAPGVELSVAEDAPLESRMIAEKILEGFGASERKGRT